MFRYTKSFSKILLLAAAVFWVASCKSAEKKSKTNTTVTVDYNKVQLEKTTLWELTGPGIKKPSYIFGTMHIVPKPDFWFSDEAKKAFGSCKMLTTEFDFSKQEEMALRMMVLGPMKNKTRLRDLISLDDFDLVKEYTNKNVKGLMGGFFLMESWKPILLTSMITSSQLMDGEPASYEGEFSKLAKERKMEFGGLESMDYQIAMFDSIPYEEQAKQLVNTVIQMMDDSLKAEAKKGLRTMIDMYKDQDIDGLHKMTTSQMTPEAGTMSEDLMLTTRNRNWIPGIEEMAKKQPTFIAVGAAHLGGPNGVLRLLMKKGYTIKPVKQTK